MAEETKNNIVLFKNPSHNSEGFFVYFYQSMRFILSILFACFLSCVSAQNKNLQQSEYYWIYKGYTAVDNGKYDEAIANYTKAISLNPSFMEAYRYRGTAYCFVKKYNEALADFDRAIKLDPEDAASFNCRGSVYEELGILSMAIKDYKKAVELVPFNKHYKDNLEKALEKEAARNSH